MRRFLITSPAWQGNAELLFDDSEKLVMLSVQDTNITPVTLLVFKEKAPVTIHEMKSAFEGTKVTIVEADFEVSFEMFWKKYNKKINKFRCIKIWDKMEKTMQVKAYFGIDAYHKYLKHESWRSKADPETYLRNQYWDNEYK